MGKKKKSTKRKSAKTGNRRIDRFGSDGSEIRLIEIRGQVNVGSTKDRPDKEKS
jgi:hypothetical protein